MAGESCCWSHCCVGHLFAGVSPGELETKQRSLEEGRVQEGKNNMAGGSGKKYKGRFPWQCSFFSRCEKSGGGWLQRVISVAKAAASGELWFRGHRPCEWNSLPRDVTEAGSSTLLQEGAGRAPGRKVHPWVLGRGKSGAASESDPPQPLRAASCSGKGECRLEVNNHRSLPLEGF